MRDDRLIDEAMTSEGTLAVDTRDVGDIAEGELEEGRFRKDREWLQVFGVTERPSITRRMIKSGGMACRQMIRS